MRLLLLISFLVSFTVFGQQNFKWDLILDSLNLTQNEIYAKTKLFIANTDKSSSYKTENDDKMMGVVLLKGFSTISIKKSREYTFSYTVLIKFRDNKAKISVYNVFCIDAYNGLDPIDTIPVLDLYPTKKGWVTTGLNEKNYLKLMGRLRTELSDKIEAYRIEIQKPKEEW